VDLSWTTPANGGSQITGFNVYRGPTATNLSLYQGLGVTTTYADLAVTAGTTYYYAVAARNAIGEGPRSTTRSATPTGVPTAPQNVSAVADAKKGIDLGWSPPASNGGSAITGYRIYRSTSPGNEIQIGSVASSAGTYRDVSTTKNGRYYYVIRAVNAVGPGAPSSEVTAIAR
jgi:fibronectin type 3 domain-containing protein